MKMVVKEVDEQGRVVIPSEWRKEGWFKANTKVELTKEGDTILIKPLRYKSLMDLKNLGKKHLSLDNIEKAEMKAAIKRYRKAKR